MARIVYALSGQGRGHSSRTLAMAAALRIQGHEMLFCCGGTAQEVLESHGESVVTVPHLKTVIRDNAVLLAPTLVANWPFIANIDRIVAQLVDRLVDFRPDLVISDFEAFSWRAADRLGVPTISFNHQQVVTETIYDLPAEHWLDAQLAKAIINVIAPKNPRRLLLTSFFFPPLRDPNNTHLVPPIIRAEVEQLAPVRGEHTLVYFNNQAEDAREFRDLLQRDGRPYIVYNQPIPENPTQYPNIVFKRPSLDEFLEDLATCRAVLCTAGFTLISEALYLTKPILAIPNRGIFEQTINALFLERESLGKAIIGRPLTASDLADFHREQHRYVRASQARKTIGNAEALSVIEEILPRIGASIRVPALPLS